MNEQEDTRHKSRRDLLLVLLILPLGVLCMFITGQTAIKLAPSWVLNADMRSFLNPNATFAAGGNQLFIEPLDPGILTLPAWGNLFLTPNAVIPTRQIPTATPPPPARTPQPPPPRNTPVEEPTATLSVPIILPTRSGPAIGDLEIEISDNSSTYTPGTVINYTITISNLGPDNALRFDVTDNIPAEISGLSVACSPAAYCGTNASSGNTVSFTGMTLPYSAGLNEITISISGTVAAGATGNLSNRVEITIAGNVRYRDPNLSNNTAIDRNTQRSVYDLAITKSDGVDTYTATTPLTYAVVVTNSVGPSDALGVRVTDNLPPQIASWTWACTSVSAASGCNGVTNSTNNFTDTVNIRVGGRIEYTVTANLAGITQNPQSLSNTASIQLPGGSGFVDPVSGNNAATDVNLPYIDLQITKDDGVTTYTPGGTVTYTIGVTNNSTFNLTGITLTDSKPSQVTNWTWCAAPPCPAPINTDFTATFDLAAGNSLTATVTANISGTAGATNLTNTVVVSLPAGLIDSVPANNSATDVDSPNIDLQITKTDGVNTYTPGGILNYTVTVTNNSAIPLNGVSVTDNLPALVSSSTWTCAGASCPTPSGTGNINSTLNLPAGAVVTFSISATVHANAAGPLVNVASVSPPAGFVDTAPGNNTASDLDINAVGEPDIGSPDGNVYSIPDGSTTTFFLSQAIVADSDPGADFVYYEFPMGAGIRLDQVLVEISSDGATWLPVFFWGNTIADTNTNINYASLSGVCPTEIDNCEIPAADLYPYPGTGITIDVDNSPLSAVPQGSYRWIRFTEPGLGSTDGAHVDAIEILP